MRSCAAALTVLVVALSASAACARSELGLGGARRLNLISRILERDPSGFSIKTGVGLGAEVDEVEASLDLGPFGFTLDPQPKAKSSPAPPAPPAGPACNKFCDPSTGAVFCCTSLGCLPNGEISLHCA